MAEELTAEQVLSRNIDKLGEDLGRLYTDLSNECVWIHTVWREVESLFGISQERVDLLNRTASYFFYVLQRSMWDHLLLHVARITDTVRALPQFLSDDTAAKKMEDNLVPVSQFSQW